VTTAIADINRARNAAHLARTVLPGPIGDTLYRELAAWAEFGHRFDKGRQAMALAADLEARHAALTAERTYG
jgi:hypothetical protein